MPVWIQTKPYPLAVWGKCAKVASVNRKKVKEVAVYFLAFCMFLLMGFLAVKLQILFPGIFDDTFRQSR
jgi:uncharacterized transporter YbjL